MGIYAGTGEYFIEEMLPVISDELNKLTSDDLEQEVMRAKTQLKAALLMSREGTAVSYTHLTLPTNGCV